ncbi:helix-turn-helix domain-containing protein [Bernardetia sp.]|uniref:helix-turn-helix domain-containing protein n=1 Tax=Bernardetia sp. TaxID=1937974 RepID=UPI0025BFA2A3|nr:helix-turn-helix domain-containing protein [Bernardetia sp.]
MILENDILSNESSALIKEFYFAHIPATSGIKLKPVIDDGCYDFIFFNEKQTALEFGKNKKKLPIDYDTFTISLSEPPYKLKFDNSITFFTIKVQPWFNASFFPLNKFHKQEGIINLESLYGKEVTKLHQELFSSNDFEEQKKLALNFVEKNKPIFTEEIRLVKSVCEKIYEKKGITSVQELAQQFELSRQTINKIFKNEVTYTLKKFIVIVRIMEVIKHKVRHHNLSFTELSYEFGYFDQAHFNNDFKRICGVSPSAFFKDLPPFLERHK